MLSHSVYVGGINNLSDARYSAGMFVDQIGLPVGGTNGLSQEKIQEIMGWLSGVRFVGQLHGIPDFSISELPFDAFEVSTLSMYTWLKTQSNVPIGWRTTVQEAQAIPTGVDFVVFEHGEDVHIAQFPEAYWELHPAFVQQEIWKKFPQMKVALQGGIEERPGFSDFGDLIDVLEALELD